MNFSEIRHDYIWGPAVENGANGGHDLLAAVSIDAWKSADDNEEGEVLANVLLTAHGDMIVDFHDNGVRMHQPVLDHIRAAEETLKQIWQEKVCQYSGKIQYPIHIGGMISVEHRRQSKVPDFVESLDMLFAQFGDSVARLSGLLSIHLDHPVNAMTAICKRLALPKKAAMEAIDMFEMAIGEDSATAHDVFVAMQEIPFILKTQGTPESKLLALQENMARALTLKWRDYDYAREVKW